MRFAIPCFLRHAFTPYKKGSSIVPPCERYRMRGLHGIDNLLSFFAIPLTLVLFNFLRHRTNVILICMLEFGIATKTTTANDARSELPYVFEVPTTLEALHDVIGHHAKTGADASTIIQRIHTTNSVRLDKRKNTEKMQNFYDVLIRRLLAVGDAVHDQGDGGTKLGRYAQLDVLVQTLYKMAQEAPNTAAAVWSRRLGILQSAHCKRVRDAGGTMDDDDEDDSVFTAWPSTGVVMALRTIGHVFPMSDRRHVVGTPTILFLGQLISHTPLLCMGDFVTATVCCGLLLEYTACTDARRLAPEAHAYIASVLRLYCVGDESLAFPLPTFSTALQDVDGLSTLRQTVSDQYDEYNDTTTVLKLSLESQSIADTGATAMALLYTALHLAETSVTMHNKKTANEDDESSKNTNASPEMFSEISNAILALDPKHKKLPLPRLIQSKVKAVVSALSVCMSDEARIPLRRRGTASTKREAIKTLAPRLEDPDRYSVSKDKGKSATKAAADRARREYKREHKAVSRELRMDGAMIAQEQDRVQSIRDATAKKRRQKAFAWLEGEQATMNQQVRQGGGLLQGGGMGAAKAKARSGKFGIKKGGKF